MADKRDYYDVLGISKNATDDDIKKAYRTLAKKYHPDVSKEKDAEAKFKEVQEAYDTLSDANKRSAYDQYGHQGNPFEGFQGGAGFQGFSDIFSQFFGGGQRQQTKRGPQAGDDIEQNITISFMEAVLGTKKTIKVDIEEDCKTCNGTGAESAKDIETCDRCHGTGYINLDQRSLFGTFRTQQVCTKCGGSGKYVKNRCQSCNGKGRVRQTKTVDVTIPAGVDTGMSLKVAGYGYGGTLGGPHGNLYLVFRVRQHNVFKRQDDDILLEVPITFTQAALGTSIDVPTIYGDVTLKVPAGISNGTALRMKEKGVSNVRSGKKGDQLVVIQITTPKNLSSQEKKLYEQLSDLEAKSSKSSWEKFKNLFKN